jgi:hypothetical protein
MTTKGLGLGSAKVKVLPTKYMSKILIDSCAKYYNYIEVGGGCGILVHSAIVKHIFSYIVAISFIGGRNRRTRRKPQTDKLNHIA